METAKALPVIVEVGADDLTTTTQLAELLGCHPFTIWKLYPSAYVTRRQVRFYSDKLYSLTKVAKLISEASGFEIKPHHLHDLVSRVEALQILKDLNKPRSLRTWRHWSSEGIGPRPIKVGGRLRYLRDEVTAWAGYLSNLPGGPHRVGQTGGHNVTLPRTLPNGPNGPTPESQGHVGGTLHLSQTSEGAT